MARAKALRGQEGEKNFATNLRELARILLKEIEKFFDEIDGIFYDEILPGRERFFDGIGGVFYGRIRRWILGLGWQEM